MLKKEAFTELLRELDGFTVEQVVSLLTDFMSSKELEQFLNHVKEEKD